MSPRTSKSIVLVLLVVGLALPGCGGGGGNGGNGGGGGNGGNGGGGGNGAAYAPPKSNGTKPMPGAGTTPRDPKTIGPMQVDATLIDLGTVAPSSSHDVTFNLTNAGGSPIRIISAKPTCACTAPQNIEGRVIEPGATFAFTSAFRAPVAAEPKEATVKMGFSADGQTYAFDLKIAASVSRWIRAEPGYVDALKGETGGQIRVASVDEQPFRILSTNGTAPVHADGYDPSTGAPRSSYLLQWHVPARTAEECAGMRLWWPVVTDHPDAPVLPVYIRHECSGGRRDPTYRSRGWYFDEYIGDVGEVKAGQSVDVAVDLRNAPNAEYPTGLSARSLSGDATATMISNEQIPGGTTACVVRFTPRAGYEGLMYVQVEVGSSTGKKDIGFIAHVVE